MSTWDDKPNTYEHAVAMLDASVEETRRLRAINAELELRIAHRDEFIEKKEEECDRLCTRNVELRAALCDAKDALYNPFKPDNQPDSYKRICAALAKW